MNIKSAGSLENRTEVYVGVAIIVRYQAVERMLDARQKIHWRLMLRQF